MSTAAPIAGATSVFKGGPTLLDLLVDANELRYAVTGPRMLFEKLVLVTTLSALDGCTAGRLREVADSVEGTVHCSSVGIEAAEITVESSRSGARLEIGLGPASMYQCELALRTRDGRTFRDLLTGALTDHPDRPFFAGLSPVSATGHLEHDHGAGPGHDQGAGAGHDHGAGAGHDHRAGAGHDHGVTHEHGGGHNHGHP